MPVKTEPASPKIRRRYLARAARPVLLAAVLVLSGGYALLGWQGPQLKAQLNFKELEMATTELPELDVGAILRSVDAVSYQRILRAEATPCPGSPEGSPSCEVEPVVKRSSEPSDNRLDLRIERVNRDPFLLDLRPFHATQKAAPCETVLRAGSPAPGQLLFAIAKTGCPLRSLVRLDPQRLVRLFLLAKNGIHVSAGSLDGLDLDRPKPRSLSRVTATLGQGTEIGLSLTLPSEHVRGLWRDVPAGRLEGQVRSPGSIYAGLHTQCMVGAGQKVALTGAPLMLGTVDYAQGSIAVHVDAIESAAVDGIPCRVELADRPIWSWLLFWLSGVATTLLAPVQQLLDAMKKLVEALKKLAARKQRRP